jgi:uncharacterized protein (UPF0332 family)
MPFAQDLLEQSRHLANREPRRPRQASLRRAVSTAYYALFHLLTTAAVSDWRIARHRSKLARAFEHGKMKSACSDTVKQLRSRKYASAQKLKSVAEAFVELQQHRHTADYDNSKKWTRTDVLAQIQSVQAAFDSWGQVAHEQIAEDFLLQLLIRQR